MHIVWDGTQECRHTLLSYFLCVTNYSGADRLYRICSMNAYIDFGRIEVGDKIELHSDGRFIGLTHQTRKTPSRKRLKSQK